MLSFGFRSAVSALSSFLFTDTYRYDIRVTVFQTYTSTFTLSAGEASPLSPFSWHRPAHKSPLPSSPCSSSHAYLRPPRALESFDLSRFP